MIILVAIVRNRLINWNHANNVKNNDRNCKVITILVLIIVATLMQ